MLPAKQEDLSLILAPHSGRREPTPINCPLTSTRSLKFSCAYTSDTQIQLKDRQRKWKGKRKEREKEKKLKEKKGKAEEKLVRASRLSRATEDFSDKSSCSGLSQVTPSAKNLTGNSCRLG